MFRSSTSLVPVLHFEAERNVDARLGLQTNKYGTYYLVTTYCLCLERGLELMLYFAW